MSDADRTLFEDLAPGAQELRPYRIHPDLPGGACALFRAARVHWNAEWGIGCSVAQPDPSELGAFYRDEYRQVMGKARGVQHYLSSPNYRAQVRSQVEWVTGALEGPAAARGRWLDLGAGYGLLLREVAQALPSWERLALEPDAAAREDLTAIARVLGGQGPADLSDPDAAGGNLAALDVVSCSHVLEHVPDPRAYVRALRERLRPGAWALIEVPNDDVDALTSPSRASDVPHLWFFSRPGLERLVSEAGLQVVRSAELGLLRSGAPVARLTRLRRFVRNRVRGRLSLIDDPSWYAEGPQRSDLRVLARR